MRIWKSLAVAVALIVLCMTAAPAQASLHHPRHHHHTSAPPPPKHVKITGGSVHRHRHLMLRGPCRHGGLVTVKHSGRPVGHARFGCNRYHATVMVRLTHKQLRKAGTKVGIRFTATARSRGERPRKVAVLLRRAPHSGTASASALARLVPSAGTSGFDAYWSDTQAYCLEHHNNGGTITVGPLPYATLGGQYGEEVWWRAFLWGRRRRRQRRLVARQYRLDPALHAARGRLRRSGGSGTVNTDVAVYIGGTSVPGEVIHPEGFSLNPGFYFWPVIESWSRSNGDEWHSVPVIQGSDDFFDPNWCKFPN